MQIFAFSFIYYWFRSLQFINANVFFKSIAGPIGIVKYFSKLFLIFVRIFQKYSAKIVEYAN